MSDNKFGIRSRAILVKVSVPGAQSKRKSDTATRQLATAMNADESAISCVVNIMPDEYVNAVNAASSRIRAENYMMTSPWGDDKARIMSIDFLEKHRASLNNLIPAYKAEVERMADSMPAIIQAAKFRLGEAFDEAMFPTPEQFKAKMQVSIRYYPIPAGEDFRVNLDEDTISYMRQELENEITQRVSDSIADVKNRLVKVVSSYIERLEKVSNYRDASGKRRVAGHVRSSITGNIQDLIDVIPALNITDDQEVVKLSNQLRADLCTYSAETLNDSQQVREAMISKAKQILKQLNS